MKPMVNTMMVGPWGGMSLWSLVMWDDFVQRYVTHPKPIKIGKTTTTPAETFSEQIESH